MTHASLFSGIGGPEIAAAMLGWENLFHCEINPFGRQILDYWFPKSKSYEDITKTDFRKWRGKVDILTGGFPCQPFSYAGQRRGAEDDRYLWPSMYRAIDEIRPSWVVAENVAGITTMVEQGEVSEMGGQASMFEEVDDIRRYRLDETFTLQRICDDLESHGYAVQPVLVPACAVGAPHRRDRVFIVARRVAADTDNDGSHRCEGNDGQARQDCTNTERNATSDGERDGLFGKPRTSGISKDAPHSDSHRGREVDEHMESELADGAKPVSNGGQRNVADTCHAGLQETRAEQSAAGHRGFDVRTCEWVERFGSGDEIGSRWQNFPSVSPVHRGNDGLPFDVDNLAIPFSKWRTESLKAYGNAIVPQVIYEIFRFIEIVEKGGEE